MSFLLAAMHRGPFEALKPVARELGSCRWLLDGPAAAAAKADGISFLTPREALRRYKSFGGMIERLKPRAVLRGCSELPEKRNPEAALAKAALTLGLPAFALEDFPGNYGGSPELTGLFVEFESLKAHHAARGLNAARVHAFGNPRYARAPRPATGRAAARRRYKLGGGHAVLWAGQPDGERCRRTLAALAPALRALGAAVLFRAHPRDAGRGYGRVLAGLTVVDITAEKDAGAAIAAADLVATQFSSMAVEAAAFGVPALFALLPGAGADYLASRGGLRSLPWCRSGAVFLLERPAAARKTLERALRDRGARRAALAAMRAHFQACRRSPGRIAAMIQCSISEQTR